jgi:hypothetical protein
VITSRLRTLRDHIRWAVSRFHEHDLFFGHGADNAWDEARLLVLGAVHLPWEMADSYLDCNWRTTSGSPAALAQAPYRRARTDRLPAGRGVVLRHVVHRR